MSTDSDGMETATLGGGCFWCVEAVFQELNGVGSVVSGYAGGTVPEPSYEEVCSGTTGYAEVVQVTFDPDVVPYADLLRVFFATHDPTTVDRQGPDVGSQYRSAIFTHDESQRTTAEQVVDEVEPAFDDPIVTEIEPLDAFYPADESHQDYYDKHPNAAYCRMHIPGKLETVQDEFGSLAK
jgi:peptide-methionine (S)-S-oxide reductase